MRQGELLSRVLRKIRVKKKEMLHHFRSAPERQKILFIVGCQRAGTTLMLRIFENDSQTKVYADTSRLTSRDKHKIRLNPLDSVKEELERVKAPVIVLKPLVESQNILKLLEYFDDSKALWMYRDYKDVAASNLNHFGLHNGIDDLRPIVENEKGNWRSDKVSKEVREVVRGHFSETMNPYDAAVLFWYARNRIYFELGLDQNPDVLVCKYGDLTTSPAKVVKGIYRGLNLEYPGEKIHKEIHAKSVNRGRHVELSPEIDQLAEELMAQLDKTDQIKQAHFADGVKNV